MKLFLIVLVVLSAKFSWAQTPTAKLLVSDRALFRIEKDVFFKEAFYIWINEWSRLECIERRSLLLGSFDLSVSEIRSASKLIELLESRSPTSIEKQSLEKMVKFVKFMLYVQSQSLTIGMPQNFSCVGQLTENLKLVGKAEAFLRSRFRENEANNNGKRNSWREDLNRARTFVDSVVRGMSHEIYL